MKKGPTSFNEAMELRDRYDYLIGNVAEGSNGARDIIENIIVAPKNMLGDSFLYHYHLEGQNSKALLRFYSYHDYAVVGIVKQEEKDGGISYYYKPLVALTHFLAPETMA
ncbi:hypothetical protein [Taibaiella soli]|uniref:Uncharacterized protein n=1 Tax=Taibaiella soli TaxID=1649169 RepID=A0A2W2B584_9BACT|nr:hypothetical protein [Taibaiella soli]PZF71187.1 hypothetical protein DN068_19625 [Taibaiella soli]